MRRLKFCAVAVLCAGVLIGCEDPSSVGVELVDEQGDPILEVLHPTEFGPEERADVTGQRARLLAGTVEDPLLGTIRATGYLDFLSRFDSTSTATVTGVTLTLRPDYVFGDTLTPLTFSLYDLVEDWNASGTRADTVLPLGALVTTFEVMPTDSLVQVPLPEAWVQANDATLRSTDFDELFHGFALEAAGNTVLGLAALGSALEVATTVDTLLYPHLRNLSTLARTVPPAVPPGLLAVQDGVGPSLRFDFDFERDDFAEAPLNGAVVRLFADTLALKATPPNFVRPIQRTFDFVAVADDTTTFSLGQGTLDALGHVRFNNATIRSFLQNVFFDEQAFSHFEARFPGLDNTLNALLIYDTSVPETTPEALLTISPFTD